MLKYKKFFPIPSIGNIFLILCIIFTAGCVPSQVAAIVNTAIAPAATATVAPTAPAKNYKLTILHTNDIHAHHEPDLNGDGGAALAASVIRQVRAANPNTLLLNAGDNFIGTLFYVLHHGSDSAQLMNAMQYDAMTLGNHEFDEGDGNLALFIQKLKFPVVVANVNFDQSGALKGKTKPYVILQKGGEKIGIIGLANPNTPTLSHPGSDLVFDANLTQDVKNNVDELTAAGVNKIILITHIGYAADLDLAKTINGVDVIVGGHTHTLLANIDKRASDVYPAVVKNPDGKNVLVVQAGEYLLYIGKLDIEFDGAGDLVQWTGDTVYLSHYITPDASVTALVKQLKGPIAQLTQKEVGESGVFLEGERTVCRVQECSMGNLITDAMRAETGAQVALENGGGIRASIKAGKVTLGDVLTVLPFGNLVSTVKLKGSDLQAVLENGVSRVDSSEGTGRFLQVSGLRFEYDPSQAAGSRITRVEVSDADGKFQPLDAQATYSLAVNDFMLGGGDDYKVLQEKGLDAYAFGRPLDQVVADYIKTNSPVKTQVEGRITTK
ncbi:MAG: 5'-nucleotidase C-terminal domain-containing protein [Anaerolineae bacterium]|nr:5'-nucleotidase C-terminal domain-containing protein [Anaerolineae bacterium]